MKIAGPISVATAFVLALAVAVAALPASAAPQGPWVQPPVDLSAPGQNASNPQIVTAPDGTTAAVWRRNNGSNEIIQASTRPPGGDFGPPMSISAPGSNADRPRITAGPDGTFTAIWQRSDGSNEIIQASTRTPGGDFGPPVDLTAPGLSAGSPQISTAADGTATAVWVRFNGSNELVQAASRPPGGDFGAPVNVSDPGQSASAPQVTTSLDDTATAVWRRSDGSNEIIQAATRPPGGIFGTPTDLSAPGQNASAPQITTAGDGTVTAVWERSDGSNEIIQAATRPPGGIFGPPGALSAPGRNAFSPQITTAPDGTSTVVWYRNNGSTEIVQAATRPPGGGFGGPVDLSAPGQSATAPRITTAADGTATVGWVRNNGSNYIIQAATRPPAGGFEPAVNLSEGGQDAFLPEVSAAPDGSVGAVWQRNNGSNYIIQSISTARPPYLLELTKAGSGRGKVTSAPAGIDCGNDCSESFPSYTEVTLTARPDSGSTFRGWGGACKGAVGNSCALTMLDDQTATARFGKPRLEVTKVKPKKPKVKRGKKVKLKVSGKNAGDVKAKNAKLCLKLTKSVRKKLKPKGKNCQKLGSLSPGKAKTKPFKLKATKKAKKGKKYKVKFKLSASNAKTVTRAVKVKVK